MERDKGKGKKGKGKGKKGKKGKKGVRQDYGNSVLLCFSGRTRA